MAGHAGILFCRLCRACRLPDGELPGIPCGGRSGIDHTAQICGIILFYCGECIHIGPGGQKKRGEQTPWGKSDFFHLFTLYSVHGRIDKRIDGGIRGSDYPALRIGGSDTWQRSAVFQNYYGRNDFQCNTAWREFVSAGSRQYPHYHAHQPCVQYRKHSV